MLADRPPLRTNGRSVRNDFPAFVSPSRTTNRVPDRHSVTSQRANTARISEEGVWMVSPRSVMSASLFGAAPRSEQFLPGLRRLKKQGADQGVLLVAPTLTRRRCDLWPPRSSCGPPELHPADHQTPLATYSASARMPKSDAGWTARFMHLPRVTK